MTNQKTKEVLITGGKGFLGAKLIKKLKKEGYEPCSYDIEEGQDILDKDQLMKAIEEREAVFHLAAVADLNKSRESPLNTMKINIEGTINVAEACLKNELPLYYASTCCVYGNQQQHPTTEESLPNPTEIYAASKLAGENVIKGYAKTCGLKYNIMRLATFYGSGMREALAVYVFLEQAINGDPITVHGDGTQTRTLTYVDDMIEGMYQLFESEAVNEIFNITTEEEVSVLDIAKQTKEMTRSNSKIKFVSQRPGQIMEEKISAQKAKQQFGWEAETTFKEGLRKSYEWFKNNKDSN